MVGPRVQRASFNRRVRDLAAGDALLETLTDSMLTCWQVLWDEHRKLHKLPFSWSAVRSCADAGARFQVLAVTAMTFMAAVDDPHRFAKSKCGAHFRLDAEKRAVRHVDRPRRTYLATGATVRFCTALYEAASGMLTRSKTPSTLKAWGLRVAQKRGHKRAVVAVARKLAVIMHRMWIDGAGSGLPRRTCKQRTRNLHSLCSHDAVGWRAMDAVSAYVDMSSAPVAVG